MGRRIMNVPEDIQTSLVYDEEQLMNIFQPCYSLDDLVVSVTISNDLDEEHSTYGILLPNNIWICLMLDYDGNLTQEIQIPFIEKLTRDKLNKKPRTFVEHAYNASGYKEVGVLIPSVELERFPDGFYVKTSKLSQLELESLDMLDI